MHGRYASTTCILVRFLSGLTAGAWTDESLICTISRRDTFFTGACPRSFKRATAGPTLLSVRMVASAYSDMPAIPAIASLMGAALVVLDANEHQHPMSMPLLTSGDTRAVSVGELHGNLQLPS